MNDRTRMPALNLPLHGRQLIEASAGTGKTWTLAALYVRLVLGHGRGGLANGLLPPHILVMTFTEAATAELRDRIRHRLQEAAAVFESPPGHPTADDFLAGLQSDIPSSDWAACAQRLTQAVSWMDESAIHTIHGWSMRALREHAFASRSLFDVQHLQDANELWSELAREYVRQHVYPLSVTALQALEAEHLTPNPDSWVMALSERRRAHQRSPKRLIDPSSLPTPRQVLAQTSEWQAQCNVLLERVRQHFNRDLVQQILDCKKTVKGALGHLRSNVIDALLSRIMDWVEGRTTTPDPDDLAKLGHQTMVAKKWPAEPAHPALLAIDQWSAWRGQQPASVRDAVLEHALHSMLHAYQQRKTQAGLFDFQDLLENLYWAVCDESQPLAEDLRRQYPVALVDEFQDTDPWQYGALDRIYKPGAENDQSALVMIGDPKQAIYSFRGADIDTYVRARQRCLELDPHSQHSLRQNRRSTPELLGVLNGLFQVRPDVFGPEIGFEPAQATPPKPGTPPAPAQPVQVVISEGGDATNAEAHRDFLLAHAIERMVQWLQSGQARPKDLAVLVRSHAQADAVMKALSRSRIPAVYLSDRRQVYQCDEARDVWLLLRALAQPRRASALRAALGTPLWGLTQDQLLALTSSDEAWDRCLDQAMAWHQHWQVSGVLPMLRQWLLDTGAATRMLDQPDGERRLTNLLHLAELLQQATHPMTAQGIAALPLATVRHLGREIRRLGVEDGPAQTRLESDDERVRVVTFHKSKGLQYTHVFIPFLSSDGAAPEARPDDEEEDGLDRSRDVLEDTRLLYVAMTRAEQSLWLGVYAHSLEFRKGETSALCRWLGRNDASTPWSPIWQQLAQDIPGLSVQIPSHQPQPVWQPPAAPPLLGGPLEAPRQRHPQWWSASFSALTRRLGDKPSVAWDTRAEQAEREIDTENLRLGDDSENTVSTQSPWQGFGAGARYGTILHDLLQWQADRNWPLAQGQIGAEWQALLDRQVNLQAGERDMITPWLLRVLQTPLSLDPATQLTLGHLQHPQHWAEMPFHFSTGLVPLSQIDQMITHDLFAGQARPALMPATLGGMVNGFIDLVFEHAGRYWVLDYKSNQLAHYDQTALQSALLEKRYDVQSVIYLLALHRLLRHRVPDYAPERHLGGAAYLFLRGIDAPGAGLVMQCPSAQLITTLDHLLSQHAGDLS